MSKFTMMNSIQNLNSSATRYSFEMETIFLFQTSNGDPEPPAIQRLFWALTEGAVASVLLMNGGQASLKALQSAGLIAGLPFTLVVSAICLSIWRSLGVGYGDTADPGGHPAFTVDILDTLGARPYKR